jgi:hypothetical protein
MLNHRGIHLSEFAALAGAIVVGLVAACSSDPARECRVGADCASGVCGSDGVCVRDGATPGLDGSSGSDGSLSDGGTTEGGGGDAAVNGCVPNKDGVITRAEVPVAAGLHATYTIAASDAGDVPVNLAGTTLAGGRRAWDFTAPIAGDATVVVETVPVVGTWYAPDFAGATYASRLSQRYDLIGVFETTPDAILLRGVVSPSATTSKTELTNTPPVPALKFPLQAGAKWNTDTSVTGSTYGTYGEKYTSEVDAAGELKTPLGTFDVLRVKTVLVRTFPLNPLFPVTVRTFAFVTECYGTVATVTSKDNEAGDATGEFTNAVEIRRISP